MTEHKKLVIEVPKNCIIHSGLKELALSIDFNEIDAGGLDLADKITGVLRRSYHIVLQLCGRPAVAEGAFWDRRTLLFLLICSYSSIADDGTQVWSRVRERGRSSSYLEYAIGSKNIYH